MSGQFQKWQSALLISMVIVNTVWYFRHEQVHRAQEKFASEVVWRLEKQAEIDLNLVKSIESLTEIFICMKKEPFSQVGKRNLCKNRGRIN